jgi:hypothetical protein
LGSGFDPDRWKKLKGIERWINAVAPIVSAVRLNECIKLYELAKSSNKNIVEIGSWLGRSSIILAAGSFESQRVPVYCVDTWTDLENTNHYNYYPEFMNNIKRVGVDKIICPLKGDSVEVSKIFAGEIDLLFIDGDHSYEGVKRDYVAWSPKVNGYIAFHDYLNEPGVTRLVNELDTDIDLTYSLAVIKKIKKQSQFSDIFI